MQNGEMLADRILQIAKNPVLEQRMKIASRERYLTHYTASAMTEKVTTLYERLKTSK